MKERKHHDGTLGDKIMPNPAKLRSRALAQTARTTGLRCVLCEKTIRGKPSIMKLQITSKEPRFIEKAKDLGFTSGTWLQGESMKGNFHKNCFDRAALIWKIAFETRAVSPR